jgi:hypothetical protein
MITRRIENSGALKISQNGVLAGAIVISLALHFLIASLLPRIHDANARFGLVALRSPGNVSVTLKSPARPTTKQPAKGVKPSSPIPHSHTVKSDKNTLKKLDSPLKVATKIREPIITTSVVSPHASFPSVTSSKRNEKAATTSKIATSVTKLTAKPVMPAGQNKDKDDFDSDTGLLAQPRLSNGPLATPSPAPPPLEALRGQRPEGESRETALVDARESEPNVSKTEQANFATTAQTKTNPNKDDLREAVNMATERSLLTSRGGKTPDSGTLPPTDTAISSAFIPHGLPFRPIAKSDDTTPSKTPPLRIVYLVDISGSMAEEGKMERVRFALSDALSELRPQDSFQIIAFSDTAAQLTGPQLLEATAENLQIGRESISKLQPNGATNLSTALELALKLSELTHIVILSDGSPSEGITGLNELRNFLRLHNISHARLIALAIGVDMAPTSPELLKTLAEESGGAFRNISIFPAPPSRQ